MVSDDTLNVMVAHICQRNVISLQERQPGIVIFKIERLAHSLWHLVDKAENTFISA